MVDGIYKLLPILIALATFIWYRSGRLWKFYYKLLDDSLNQFQANQLDRKAWKSLANEQLSQIVSDHFGVLFHVEMDYLRFLIEDNQYILLKSSSSAHSQPVVDKHEILAQETISEKITDDKAFCRYTLSKLFSWKFRFGGTGLFFCSIVWCVFKKNRDKGIEIKKEREPIRNIPSLKNQNG